MHLEQIPIISLIRESMAPRRFFVQEESLDLKTVSVLIITILI